jgi:NTP pyrophosphatase (non-canonical NTP hydrolase)
MNETEYLEKSKRTLSTRNDLIEHMAYGMVTESAEILDALKKHKFYGRELNITNIKEEVGDCMWYMYQLLDELNYSPEQCRQDNILKLQKRYPEKFEDVLIRDTQIELEHIK